jgi:hypothetical protein
MKPVVSDFGYCPFIRRHSMEVWIDAEGATFNENTHGRHSERRIIPKAWLPRPVWDLVSGIASRELNRLIKLDSDIRHCRKAKWKEQKSRKAYFAGYSDDAYRLEEICDGKNEVELNIGRELVVLAWALEHATAPESIMSIAATWSAFDSVDRFFFYRLVNARCGEADDRNSFIRQGLSLIFQGRTSA